MADYVALDPEIGTIAKFVANDTYQISISNNEEDETFEIIVNSGNGGTDNDESGGTDNDGSGGTDNGENIGTTVNDTYQTSSSANIVLDVLANDTFTNKEVVVISETSQPNNGEVVINTDNTLTYTPSSVEASENTFTYTAEFVTDAGTMSSETATVTVNINPPSALKLSGPNIFYVTVDGKSDNTGSSEAIAWNIQHAFSVAKAGDFIYVKAGNYGDVKLTTARSGTASNPITFIGYTDIPGELESSSGHTVTYQDYKENGDSLDSSQMPLLQGTRTSLISSGVAITVSGNYVNIENFQLRHYDYGIKTSASNGVFRNIISTDMGNFNPNDSYNPYYPNASNLPEPDIPSGGTSSLAANLTGQGIWIAGGDYNKIENSITINSGARGFVIVNGTLNQINYCEVWSDQNVNPTDYYIMIYGGTNNSITGGHIERVGNLTHRGHGLSMKCDSSYNNVSGLTLVNTSVELNGNINNSTFTEVRVQGGTWGGFTGGIKLDSGCYNNTFANCSNYNGEGLIFLDSVEGDCGNGTSNASHDNTFINLIIANASTDNHAPIAFHWNSQGGRLTSAAYNNKFNNCTFEGSEYVFRVDRVNSGNDFVDCTFSNFSNELRSSRYSVNESISLGVSFTNCNWTNIAFPIPN